MRAPSDVARHADGPSTRTVSLAWYTALAIFAAWAGLSLTWPLGGDQGIMLWVGDVIRSGGMPYQDAFEIKGPAYLYVHALVAAIFGRAEWGIRVFDLLFVATGSYLVARIVGGDMRTVAVRAAVATFLLLYASLDYWDAAQPDGWAGVLIAAVVMLLMERRASHRPLTAVLVGTLLGIIALGKPTYAMFTLLPLAHGVMQRGRGVRWMLTYWTLSALAFIVTIGACVAWFAARGALDDLIDVHLRWTGSVYSGLDQLAPLHLVRLLAEHLLFGRFAVCCRWRSPDWPCCGACAAATPWSLPRGLWSPS